MTPGIKLTLGGTEYTVPPLALGTIEDMEDQLKDFRGGIDADSVKTVIDATTAGLQRNYPDITRDEVRGMLDLGNMIDVMQALMDVSGIKRKELEAGEALRLAQLTGQPSMPTSAPVQDGPGITSETT